MWTATLSPKGYGQFYLNGRLTGAHRAAYELFIGPIPKDHVVRHICDNPPCVNPDHLLTGSQADNLQDMVNRGRHHANQITHCPKGHEYDKENTAFNTKGGRKCRMCLSKKIECICGLYIRITNIRQHQATIKHAKRMENLK